MNFEKLVRALEKRSDLPMEVTDIRAEIQKLGIQDEIIFHPADIDPEKLWGLMYQFKGTEETQKFTRQAGVYGEPIRCALIVYNKRLPTEWQRVVCAKEAIHLLDPQVERTASAEELVALVDKLLGPMATGDFGFADFVAAKDKLALYQALMLLVPNAARTEALEALAKGTRTIDQIHQWTAVPRILLDVVLAEKWPELAKDLFDC